MERTHLIFSHNTGTDELIQCECQFRADDLLSKNKDRQGNQEPGLGIKIWNKRMGRITRPEITLEQCDQGQGKPAYDKEKQYPG